MQEIVRAECSILFVSNHAIFLSPLGEICILPPTYKVADQASGTGTSVADDDQADTLDAVQPIHDRLMRQPFWWLLEIIFTAYTPQQSIFPICHWT